MPVDAQDIAELNYHTDVALDYLINMFTYTICLGAGGIVIVPALVHLAHRASSNSATKVLFVVITLQFLVQIGYIVAYMIVYVVQINSWHLDSTATSIQFLSGFPQGVITLLITADIFNELSIPITNAVIIWRAWVLYSSNRVLRILLVVAWICAFGFNLAVMSVTSYMTAYPSNDLGTLGNKLVSVQYFISFGLNAMATIAIVWKVWNHRLLLKAGNIKRSRVIYILFHVIEWGVMLCLAQLLTAIIAVIAVEGEPTDPRFITYVVFTNFLSTFATVYPALIVLVLAKGQSVIENATIIDRSQNDGVQRTREHLSTLRFEDIEVQGKATEQSREDLTTDTIGIATENDSRRKVI